MAGMLIVCVDIVREILRLVLVSNGVENLSLQSSSKRKVGGAMLQHNSYDSFYRSPAGAVPQDEIVELFIKTDEGYESCTLHLWTPEDKENSYEMQKTATGFKINVEFDTVGIYWYYFLLSKDGVQSFYCCRESYSGGEGNRQSSWTGSFQVTVYDKHLQTPEWFKNTIMYQIFPDRFNRRGIIQNESVTESRSIHYNWHDKPDYFETGSTNADFFGGNFNGVKDKLLYLKELGVGVIYFNPIFESESNHRYDTGDYKKLDWILGDEQEFMELVQAAEGLGIRILLDGVFSHTGSDSRYFNKNGTYDSIGAVQSKESPYYSWYRFDHFPNTYECWWGIDTLPNVNENDPSFQKYVFGAEDSVVDKWMDAGIKGWRLDVADELPDEFLEGFYTKVKEKDKDAVVIGEVWEDASSKRSYGKLRKFVLGKQFDSIMNYPIRNLVIDFIAYGHQEEGTIHRSIDAEELAARLLNLYHNYPVDVFYCLMNFLSTHDTHRIMTIFEEASTDKNISKKLQHDYEPTAEQRELGMKRLKMAWTFIATMPGVPSIYYGDEIGMTGFRDPFNRNTYPWGDENLELFDFFKRINGIRNGSTTLTMGTFEPICCREDIYAHERKLGSDSIIFLMNRSRRKAGSVHLDMKNSYVDLESGETYNPGPSDKVSVDISVLSYKVLRKMGHLHR